MERADADASYQTRARSQSALHEKNSSGWRSEHITEKKPLTAQAQFFLEFVKSQRPRAAPRHSRARSSRRAPSPSPSRRVTPAREHHLSRARREARVESEEAQDRRDGDRSHRRHVHGGVPDASAASPRGRGARARHPRGEKTRDARDEDAPDRRPSRARRTFSRRERVERPSSRASRLGRSRSRRSSPRRRRRRRRRRRSPRNRSTSPRPRPSPSSRARPWTRSSRSRTTPS